MKQDGRPDAPAAAQPPRPRRFIQWWRRQWRDIDRAAVNEQVSEEGGLSYSFVFLVVASCGIATLGLMLNSAAVIIGAMLIAPMMGPIVLLGFAIAATDVEKAVRSAKALAIGVAASLAISTAIVKLSPYIPPTPEILARAQPNPTCSISWWPCCPAWSRATPSPSSESARSPAWPSRPP